MKQTISAVMTLLCVIAFSMDVHARGPKPKAETTTTQLKENAANRGKAQGRMTPAQMKATAIQVANRIANLQVAQNTRNYLSKNLSEIIQKNPTAAANMKVSAAKVKGMVKALSKITQADMLSKSAQQLSDMVAANLRALRDRAGKALFELTQVEKLRNERCRI